MKIKSLKKLAEMLNRSEGASLIAIIAMLVIMSVMGGVFSSVMGRWKISAPTNINSSKAIYLAETAAMFALQDARYRFYGGSFNFGTSTDDPYVVSSVTTSNVTEVADYWFEMPDSADDATTGTNDDVIDDDADDGNSSDDVDGDGNSDLHTIIATGRVNIGGTTVAKRQIKFLATIYPSPADTVAPGVQTSGVINGTGGVGNGFGMEHNGFETEFIAGTDDDEPDGSEASIVIRPPNVNVLDENFVKILATDQGHFNAVDLVIDNSNDDYPEPATPSYYYDSPTDTIPNMTYVGRDFTVGANRKAHGVIWVKGDVVLNGTATMDAIIICEGNVTFNGDSDIVGGIIHYGDFINVNGNPNAITVKDSFFDALNATIPIITVVSSQEAVSAN